MSTPTKSPEVPVQAIFDQLMLVIEKNCLFLTGQRPLVEEYVLTALLASAAGGEKKTVTESIYDCDGFTIPLAEVQHIESRRDYRMVVFKSSTYNNEAGEYNNAICLSQEQYARFSAAWCRYRSELEASTLMDLSPNKEKTK